MNHDCLGNICKLRCVFALVAVVASQKVSVALPAAPVVAGMGPELVVLPQVLWLLWKLPRPPLSRCGLFRAEYPDEADDVQDRGDCGVSAGLDSTS